MSGIFKATYTYVKIYYTLNMYSNYSIINFINLIDEEGFLIFKKLFYSMNIIFIYLQIILSIFVSLTSYILYL